MTSQLETLREGLAGRYDVDSELGRGGMSIVYRARDLKHDRAVAIKVLHPELSSTLARERFHQEIALAAKLQHPNIVPVYDSGETGGLVFYVMPEVDGESLRERLAREPQLPLDEAVRIVEDVVEGLSHAHEQGIIHRDVKPGNILLTGGRAVVVDFGIARAASIAGGSKLTTSGIVLGTPAYMSPEQAVGERDIDRRTDVYSLGCVLYEMLAGEPPFTGPNAQAVIARQVQAPAPSLALVRPDLPIGVFDTVDRALAKARVDRFGTAEELRRALNEGAATARASGTRGPARNRLGTRALVALAVVLTVAGAAWRLFFTGGSGFDENRVMVFPLAERGDVTLPVGIGETVALAIGSALEGADPLRWIDGWLWLGGPEREDISRLTAVAADSIAQHRRARYRLNGSVVGQGDQASVVLTLFDVAEQTEVIRHTETGISVQDSIVQLGLRGAVELLPPLLEPGREEDPTPLLQRHPSAVALYLLGNREYRRSRFSEALSLYDRALEQDSAMAGAALRAAPAASWLDRSDRAAAFVGLALAHRDQIPNRQVDFALGLDSYLRGEADSAVARLRRAVEGDPEWPDAWMALGETYRHLLPRGGVSDSLRNRTFETALESDPDFTPPHFHLAESALWSGDTATAAMHIQTMASSGAETRRVEQLTLMMECVREGVDSNRWARKANMDPLVVVEAAYSLAPAADFTACAKAGFRSVFVSDSVEFLPRWDALLGLQSLLVAAGDADSARALIGSAVESGIGVAMGLYVLDAIAGADLEAEAQAFVDRLGTDYDSRGAQGLWLLGEWEASRGDVERLGRIARALEAKARQSGRRTDILWSEAIQAQLAALEGRVEEALDRLGRLRPTARRADVTWSMWESLGFERLLEARLLLANGDATGAEAVAAELDHPAPMIYRILLPRSLELRAEAAERRGDTRTAASLRARLEMLRGTEGEESR